MPVCLDRGQMRGSRRTRSRSPGRQTNPRRSPARCLPCDDRCVAERARERREAIRQLADMRRRLAAAEDALADALAAMTRAEEGRDAASDRFDAAERVVDDARGHRVQARRVRHAARLADKRTAMTTDRLQRRVTDSCDWLAGFRSTAPRRKQWLDRRGTAADFPASRVPYSPHKKTLTMSRACRTVTGQQF